jgi:broad specificity phosphatase PhoE
MPRIFILRHGETEGNQKKIFRGQWDLPLNENGRIQATRTGEVLKGISFSRIYTSPLCRAKETAAMVASEQMGTEVLEEPALVDIDYGDWSRVPDADAERRFPAQYRMWKEAPETVIFPNGEGLVDVRSRVEPFLQKCGAGPVNEQILFVSHRVTIKVILCTVLGIGNEGFWNIMVDTTSLSVVNIQDGKMSLISSNDTCHLKPLAEKFDSADF